MSRISDYRNKMTLNQFTDDDIELLLSTGEAADPGLSDLSVLLTAIRDESISEPSTADVDRLARGAAAVARSKATTNRTVNQSHSRRPALLSLRTYSAVAMTIFALVAVSSFGLVANAAVPGDALYVLDLAMEKVGIGAGALGERVSEARVLADRGDHDEAVAHLADSISEAGDTATGEDLAAAVTALNEYEEMVEEPLAPGTPTIGDPANDNAGPDNNNAGGNNDNPGPDNNNAGGNNDNAGPDNNNAGGNNDNAGPDNNNAGGNNDNAAPDNNNAGGNNDNAAPGNAGGNGKGKGGN